MPKDRHKITNPYVNFIAGATQASLVTIVGYPFDLVKVKLQAKEYSSSLNALNGIITKNGITGIYKGSAMPWLSHLVKRPLQFTFVEYLKHKKELDFLGPSKNFFLGTASSVIGPVFSTPLQVMKIRTQTLKENISITKLASKIYLESGFKGFYRGFTSTLLKDCLFGSAFVGFYYTFRDHFGHGIRYYPINNNIKIPIPIDFFSGATALCLTWSLLMPIDFIKTSIQKSDKPKTITDVIIKNYTQHGIRVFWKGLVPACMRTIPVSGIAMTGYEKVRIILSDKN